jgi:hypothetical protein
VKGLNKTHHFISSSTPWNSRSKARLPETTPSDPVLADILNVGRLRKKLIHLVANTQLAVVSEVSSSKLLLDSCKNLESTGILRLSGFLWNTLWGIKDTPFKDRGATATGEVTRLGTVLEVYTFDDGLAAFCGKRYSFGRRLLCTQTPVDQGIVDEL